MLILSRRIGESVVIGDYIYCTLLGLTGNEIRLGIDAPSAVSVHRNEIHERIMKERKLSKAANDETHPDLPMIERLIARFKKKNINHKN